MRQVRSHRILVICIAALMGGILSMMAVSIHVDAPLGDLSQGELEGRLEYLGVELTQLASYSLRAGSGAIGYRSAAYDDCDHTEWIQIELGDETAIDQIVLVPTIWRDTEGGYVNDGFPEEFKVFAGNADDANGRLIASITATNSLLPRIAPFVISCPGIKVSWVRVVATRLSPRAFDGKFILQLSEILVFNRQENVALRKAVKASSPSPPRTHAWGEAFLVDGFMPYQMNAAQGTQSLAFVGRLDPRSQAWLTIDLEETLPISGIHLHLVDQSDTVPQSDVGDFGMPRHLLIEGAKRGDFSDAAVLLDFQWNDLFHIGPIIMLPFPEASCRFVRLTAIDPFVSTYGETSIPRIGFAEIEVLATGRNVALGIPVTANVKAEGESRPLSHLTDGQNLLGQILPVRDWMNQLARRHELETQRPLLLAELALRHERQKTNLNRMSWLVALLAAGIIFTILVDRMIRMREIARIRERFAADLHDELGANLHTIGLLGDVALNAMDAPDRLRMVLGRSRELTEQTGNAVRHCLNLQEASGLRGSLKEDMQRTAKRILADLEHDISFEGEAFLKNLNPRTRSDLFLFYKESLVNISRHAAATRFSTRLTATGKTVLLSVTDNGCGLPESNANVIPRSLKRRAHLLGAQVSTAPAALGGTRITLKLRLSRFGFRR